MKNKILSLLLLIFSLLVHGQYESLPIIDSTVACSYYYGLAAERNYDPDSPKKYTEKVHMVFFHIVEQMPIPNNTFCEVESELIDVVNLKEQDKELSGEVFFQCLVNCKGKAGDFQVLHCPDKLANIWSQAFDVIQEQLLSWQPGKQRGTDVDVLIQLRMAIDNSVFKVSTL